MQPLMWPYPNARLVRMGHFGRHLNAPTTELLVSAGHDTQPPEKPAYFPTGHYKEHGPTMHRQGSHDDPHEWRQQGTLATPKRLPVAESTSPTCTVRVAVLLIARPMAWVIVHTTADEGPPSASTAVYV